MLSGEDTLSEGSGMGQGKKLMWFQGEAELSSISWGTLGNELQLRGGSATPQGKDGIPAVSR